MKAIEPEQRKEMVDIPNKEYTFCKINPDDAIWWVKFFKGRQVDCSMTISESNFDVHVRESLENQDGFQVHEICYDDSQVIGLP